MGSMEFHGIHGIPWIPWNSMESMEFHGFHGLSWNPWNSMESMEFHGIHRIPWIPWNSMESMEFHGLHGIHYSIYSTVKSSLDFQTKIQNSRGPPTSFDSSCANVLFFQLLYLIQCNYTVLYIHYCIYSTVKSSLDFQKKIKIHAAHQHRSIPVAWIFDFFSYYIWYSTVIQYCIVYTLLYIQYCTLLLQQYSVQSGWR